MRVLARLLLGVCLLVSSTMQVVLAHNTNEEEQLLKAAFIYNFVKFTGWPESTWQEKDAPLMFCIAGKDELVDKIMLLDGRSLKGRTVSVQLIDDLQTISGCHVLFIASSEKDRYIGIVKAVRGKPVLTVSEIPGFGRLGGVIELYRENKQNRFIINLGVAREAGLEVSSRLLNLAVVIEEAEQ